MGVGQWKLGLVSVVKWSKKVEISEFLIDQSLASLSVHLYLYFYTVVINFSPFTVKFSLIPESVSNMQCSEIWGSVCKDISEASD